MSTRISSTTAWTVVGRFGALAAFASSLALLTLLLDASALGTYIVAQAVAAFASPIAAGGENRTATLLLSGRSHSSRSSIYRQWAPLRRRRLTVGAAVSLALVVLLCRTVLFRLGLDWRGTLFIGIVTVGLGWQLVAAEILRASDDARTANFGTGRSGGLVTQSTLAVLLLIAWMLDYRIGLNESLGLLAAAVATGLVHLVAAIRALRFQENVDDLAPVELPDGRPVSTVAAEMVVSSLTQLDLVFAGFILAGPPLTTYALARRLTSLLATPLLIGALAATPSIAVDLRTGVLQQLRNRLGTVALLSTAVTVFAAAALVVGIAALGSRFGLDPLEQLTTSVMVLAAAQIVNALTGPSGLVMILAGEQNGLTIHGVAVLSLLVVAFAATFAIDGSELWLAVSFASVTIVQFTTLAFMAERRTGVRTTASWAVAAGAPLGRQR